MKRKLLYEQIMESLVLKIRDGSYQPGSKLPSEQELAEEYQVSRNSIREALKCLAAAKIIISKSGKGSFVAENAEETIFVNSMTLKIGINESLAELLEVRMILEPKAAAFAATRARPDQLEEMESLFAMHKKQQKNKKDLDDLGPAFHIMVSKMAGNMILVKVMTAISDELLKSRNHLPKTSQFKERFNREHEQIYNAIVNRNPEEAKTLMKYHIAEAKNLYL